MKNLSFYELGLCVSSLTTLGNVGLNALYTFEINLPQFKVQFYKWSILRNSNDLSKITQLISDYIWIRSNFPVAQMVKRLPTMQETQVQSLGWDDFLEKEMATHSSILAWKIPWTEEPGRLQSMGSQRVGHDWETSLCFTSLHFTLDQSTSLSCHFRYLSIITLFFFWTFYLAFLAGLLC